MSKSFRQTTYVAALLICDTPSGHKDLLLVRKRKPDWQAGLLNFIGGKVEDGETLSEAMAREFVEETGIHVPHYEWDPFCFEHGRDYVVWFFRHTFRAPCPTHKDVNDVGEDLDWYSADTVMRSWNDLHGPSVPVVGNLRWLVPMALDWRRILTRVDVKDDISKRPSW